MSKRFHFGRLFDHVHIHVRDFEASKRFYRAVFEALDVAFDDRGDYVQIDEFSFGPGAPASTGLHIAFQARDHATVRAFHRSAIGAGGRDNGAPGPRPYKPGYYAAFVLDPDGNNIEAVMDGTPVRSADSVVMEWPD